MSTDEEVTNLRVASLRALQPPSCVFEDMPGDVPIYSQVIDTRHAITNMLSGREDRLLVVIGLPRTSTDADGLMLIAEAMRKIAADVRNDLVIVLSVDATMNQDPDGDSTYRINKGIRRSRELILQLNRLGLPSALEFRDTITPQFFADLLSFASVASQSEALQELVSGLSMPVGVRVPADDASAVVRALDTSSGTHHFLGVSAEGVCGVVKSTGNPEVIAVAGAGAADGAKAGEAVSLALAKIHRSRPAVALMGELTCEGLSAADVDASVASFCENLTGGGSLGSRVMGLKLFLSAQQAASSDGLSGFLGKLADAVQTRRRSVSPRRPTSAAAGTETDNLRILDVRPLLPPACLLEELERDASQASVVRGARAEIAQILGGESDRVIVLAGPAVVDQPAAALEYAARLAMLAREVKGEVLVVMRAEVLAPITPSSGPWAGMLWDPDRDGTYHINRGIREARGLFLRLSRLGLPIACEFRETITPQFFADLVAWSSVSAQSEQLSELVSGLSMPTGMRAPQRTDDGAEDAAAARAALAAAGQARLFLGVTAHGLAGVVESIGNEDCALVLGGGKGDGAKRAKSVLGACAPAGEEGGAPVVAECGSGGAVDSEQIAMVSAIAAAVGKGQPAPVGVSLHSYLLSGSQPGSAKTDALIHGLCTTEPCMDWLSTETLVRELAAAVKKRRAAGNGGKKKRARE